MGSVPDSQHEYEGSSAGCYDDLRTGDPKWLREQEIVRNYLQTVAGPESAVLDVPVGTGRFLPLYAEIGCSAMGVDISEDMLTEAETVRGADQTLRTGDITQLELDDSSFDISICVRFINLVDLHTAQRALTELARVTSSHLILGMRTRSGRPHARSAVRKIRNRLRGHDEKLTVHTADELSTLLESIRASIVERTLVVDAKDGSSSYHIYLLSLGGQS